MTHLHSLSGRPDSAAIAFPICTAEISILPNGLGIIVQEDHSAPVVSVQIWVETGSIHEDRHLGAGLSHLLEHMLFKGTKTRLASEFAQGVQDAGGYINAYTSFDRTVYWIDIPKSGAPVAIELLADAVLHSTLPADEFVKEQEVIRREFAMGNDDPDRVSSLALFAAAYREHPYRHPIIGHLDIFNGVTHADLAAFYKARYAPNNMFFVVVGDVDSGRVRAQIGDLFAAAPRQSMPPLFIPAEPPQLGRREAHTEFATELTRLHLAWHVPALTHPETPTLDVAAVALGSGRSSRLYKRLREELALVQSADAWCYAPGQAGLFGVDAILDADKRELAQAELLRSVMELRENGITQRELAKAKKASLSHQLQSLTTMRGRASDLGANWLLTRNLDFSREYLEAVQRVTAEDIASVLQTHVTEDNFTVVSLNPVGTVAKTSATRVAKSAGEIQKFQLANGLRLLVREDSRLPLVAVTATFRAGLLAETAADNGITRLLSRVILKGTKTRTAEQIADEIEELGGSIGSDAGSNSLSISVRAMQPDLRAGLEVLADVLLHATMPERAVAREKEAQFAALKTQEEEPTVVARNLLRAEVFGAHPYGLKTLGSRESVAGLTQADLIAFRDRHCAAGNCVLAVFGDVRAAEVRALVEDALGHWGVGNHAGTEFSQPPAITESREIELTREKEQAVLMVGFAGVDLFSPEMAALELIDEACSDLGSRLFLRIREQMGLAYFVGTSHMAGLARGMFTFYLGTAPAKLEEVKAALGDEIAKLARDGLTAEELARAKQKFIGQQEIRNQSNPALAYQAALNELYGLGHDHHLVLRREIEALTAEDVRRVCRAIFQQPSVTTIVRPHGG